MEGLVRRFRRLHLDGWRQPPAQRRQQTLRPVPPGRIHMKNLSARVHAGVGAPASVKADFRLKKLREPALEMILHRIAISLALPAGKRSAVVCDKAFPARACRCGGC